MYNDFQFFRRVNDTTEGHLKHGLAFPSQTLRDALPKVKAYTWVYMFGGSTTTEVREQVGLDHLGSVQK